MTQVSDEVKALSFAQLKELIKLHREEEGFEDAPALNSSEEVMEEYIQKKVDEGKITLGNTGDGNEDSGSDNSGDDSGSGDDSSSATSSENDSEGASQESTSGDASADSSDDSEDSDGPAVDSSLVKEGERAVEVALMKPVWLTAGVKTMPKFDEDGLPTVRVKVGIALAKTWEANGTCKIYG